MLDIQTVLCPVDFSPLSDRTVRVAGSLSHWFKARLVLHHNLDPEPPDFLSVGWMYSEDHEGETRETEGAVPERLLELLEKLPEGIRAEAKLTHGSLDHSVLKVAKLLPADMIVMGTHGWSGAEHRSLAEKLISSAPCPVLTTNENCDPEKLFRPRKDSKPLSVLVPIDLKAGSQAALAFVESMELMPHEVHVVHVVDEIAGDPDIQAREARDRIRALMPESLKSQAFIDVRFGEVGEALLQMAAEIDPLFMVMPAHRKGFLSRLMSGDRAFEVLHGSPCPVCFVPPAAQTAT